MERLWTWVLGIGEAVLLTHTIKLLKTDLDLAKNPPTPPKPPITQKTCYKKIPVLNFQESLDQLIATMKQHPGSPVVKIINDYTFYGRRRQDDWNPHVDWQIDLPDDSECVSTIGYSIKLVGNNALDPEGAAHVQFNQK